jgi:hypothetical protein
MTGSGELMDSSRIGLSSRQSVSRVLEADADADVACAQLLHLVALAALHPDQPADALLGLLGGVPDVAA